MTPMCGFIDCAVPGSVRRAHIPGAVHLPVHYYIKETTRRAATTACWSSARQFEALMASWAWVRDTFVVTYDDNNAMVASRSEWVLTYYGHTNVKVLNGGWPPRLTENRPSRSTRPGQARQPSRRLPIPDVRHGRRC